MKRFTIRVGLYKLKRVAKPTRGNGVITAMTGNPNFPSIETNVMLTELQTASNNLQAANAAVVSNAGSHKFLSIALEKEIVWDLKYGVVSRYVQGKADANLANSKSIIESAGFNTRKTREAAPIPDVVATVLAIFTGAVDTILVKWSLSKNSRWYQLFMTTTPTDENSWVSITAVSKRKYLVTGLQSGTRYYFRVVAVGTAGAAIASDAASQITTIV